MSTYIKSNKVLNSTPLFSLEYIAYRDRVQEDGGVIIDESTTRDSFTFAINNGITDGIVISPSFGVKYSGVNVVKLYSLFGDIDMTTSGLGMLSTPWRYLHLPGSSSALISSASDVTINDNFGMAISVKRLTGQNSTAAGFCAIGNMAGGTSNIRANLYDSPTSGNSRITGTGSGNGITTPINVFLTAITDPGWRNVGFEVNSANGFSITEGAGTPVTTAYDARFLASLEKHKINIGAIFDTDATSILPPPPLSFSEFWLINSPGSGVMQQITTRLANKYPN